MENYLKKIWKDSVFSNLIAFILIGVFTTIYNFMISYFKNIDFIEQLSIFWNLNIKLWIVSLCIFLYFIIIITLRKIRKNHFVYDNHTKKLDFDLYQKIRIDLIKPNDVNNLKTYTFSSAPFDIKDLDFIDRIFHNSKFPQFEFINPKLEILKVKLLNSIEELEEKLKSNIFGTDINHPTKNFISIPREWDVTRRQNAQNEIEIKEKQVCEDYDNFIKTARRIIKI